MLLGINSPGSEEATGRPKISKALREIDAGAVDVTSMDYLHEVYGDIPSDRSPLSTEYCDSVLPDHVKQRIKR